MKSGDVEINARRIHVHFDEIPFHQGDSYALRSLALLFSSRLVVITRSLYPRRACMEVNESKEDEFGGSISIDVHVD